MDKDRLERMTAPNNARRVIPPANELARKRLHAIAGPISVARRPVSVDEKRAVRLAGSITNARKATIGGA
jgi:hypothetical protein